MRRSPLHLTNRPSIRRVASGLFLISILTVCSAATDEEPFSVRAPWNGEILGSGAKRPTTEQWAWGEANMLKGKGVRLNGIGLHRINEARARRGLPPVSDREPVVEVGAEVSAATTTSTALSGPGALPGYVDNSTLPYFPPIRSQGSLNSCAQFSAVYYTLTHMTAMARNVDAKNGGDSVRFSPKWTYNMVNGGGNNGSWHYDAYAIALKHGMATWAEFPYDGDYRGWCLDPAVWRNALYVRAATSGKVADVDAETGLSQVKQLLVNGYVLNFATYINSWAWTAIKNDPATTADEPFVGKQAVYMVNGTSGGHAMTIVGYNDDLWIDVNGDGQVAASEKGALRIANSWGTGWGEGGFCWLAYDAIRKRNPGSTSEGIFWYDEATWVTVRPSYTPKLIAEFALNHLKRNQLVMSLGASDLNSSTPTTTWTTSRLLASAGGAYAFDGSTVAREATFCLDLTDLIPSAAGLKRYYLGMRDSTTGDPALLSSMKLIDLARGTEVVSARAPQQADASTVYAYADYDAGTGVYPPVAAGIAEPTSGYVVLPVSFDASASSSQNGAIVSYQWDFGDGASGSGISCQHLYTKPGNFTAKLTVFDSTGASSSASTVITAMDPNVLNAPSDLSAAVSGRTVTLRWTDNSPNETAFVIERGSKVGTGKNAYVFVVAGSTPANTASFGDVVAAGTYYYRVKAVNSATGIASDFSNQISVRVK